MIEINDERLVITIIVCLNNQVSRLSEQRCLFANKIESSLSYLGDDDAKLGVKNTEKQLKSGQNKEFLKKSVEKFGGMKNSC